MSIADADARAAAASALEDLQQRLEKEEKLSEQYRRQGDVLQSKLDDAVKESHKLEEKVHEHDELIETLKNEKREAVRQIREMESIYEAERSAILKEKEEMANKEEEMQTVIQRLKDSLAQRSNSNFIDDDVRPTRQCEPHLYCKDKDEDKNILLILFKTAASTSPSLDGSGFAPPSSLQRSDSRNSSKLILQKDKLIESLRLELAEAQIKLVESENQGGGRLHEVERQLMEARMSNARLMEDNESYQLLLQERTLKGDFGQGDFGYMGNSVNHEALNALEGNQGSSLADELSDACDGDAAQADLEQMRRLETENKSLKEQNKALSLYINKIIERLLQHQDFETILDQSGDMKPSSSDKEKDLPPPPAEKQQQQQQQQQQQYQQHHQQQSSLHSSQPFHPAHQMNGNSLAQRSSKPMSPSVIRPRPRPFSVMSAASAPPSADHTDPEKAPSIPIGALGRAARRGRPQSEQFTGAANLISQMYKGPDTPSSPPLGNPRHSHAFFPTAGMVGTPGRIPSGSQVPASGNFPGMRSETSSLSSNSGEISTPPSHSPPRSHSDKQKTFTGKPRPLRLVEEQADIAKDANKRTSWIWGWGNKSKEDASSQHSRD
ncbi:hypothetical protein ESCO_005055 [Escovopsis weberi]|uniref:M serotype n=1 Tax=Escovopsis weberi TaxID=150374 RepID=A0A0M8N7C1_ESCWE|nr:hypothetical protein ESCO_005055 [Escovopsis weberi]